MATGNGRSDSHVGERGFLKGGQMSGGEAQPSDDRCDAKMASPSFHMILIMRFCLLVLTTVALQSLFQSRGIFFHVLCSPTNLDIYLL